MKHGYSALGLAVTGALVLTGISPVAAAEEATVADDIRSAASSQATNAASIESDLANEVEVKGAVVSAGTGSGTDIELQLPGTPLATEENEDLLLNVTGDDTYTTAVQDTGSGTFRALMHIESAAAPKEYRFDLGTDGELIPLEDGGVTVRDLDGDLLGSFEPAWAVDALGKAVPSSYRIEGNALIQTVAFTGNTAFPVVADPFWIPALLVMARISAHAASRAAARGVSQALIKQVVQNGVKSAGNKGTSVFTQGSGKNKIRVIVDNKTGNVITVTKG